MGKFDEATFRKRLIAGGLKVPPLDISVIAADEGGGEDAVLEISWRERSCRFVVELKRDAKPQTLRLAREQALEWARRKPEAQPMVIAPYLSSEKLEELLGAGVSALDFCGNGAVEAPGQFLFYKAGNPNRFPERSALTSAYRGDGSLVSRALLFEREFTQVGDIRDAIIARGGMIAPSTVSKILQRLESELVIERPNRNAVRVIQPERILDGLLEAYRPPRSENTWTGKIALPSADLMVELERLARKTNLVRTGESSAAEYATWAAEPIVSCYCREVPTILLEELGCEVRETAAFPNLQLCQTDDQRVYFDRRQNLAASPIQAWLEMSRGDKRQKEVAAQIRGLILTP